MAYLIAVDEAVRECEFEVTFLNRILFKFSNSILIFVKIAFHAILSQVVVVVVVENRQRHRPTVLHHDAVTVVAVAAAVVDSFYFIRDEFTF